MRGLTGCSVMVKRLMLVMALVTAGFSGRAQAASLKVTISPSQAVAAGGQWRRVGTSDWFDNGATETDIPAGSHQVEFRAIGGWAPPAPQSVTLTDTQSYTMSGAYRLGGALCVTLLPPEAAGGGAQWRRTGTTTWLDSGATEDSIATGTQTIEFKSTTGWGAPANQSVRIDASVTTQAVATFSLVQSGVSWGSYLGCSQTTVNAGYRNCVDSRSISVALDKDGNVLACGAAIYGDWASDGYDNSYNGGSDDAYVVKISPAGEHLWSTFMGGSLKDVALGVASDGEGNVYVTGETYSYGWVSGGFNERFNSDVNTDPDAFIAKLSPSGQHIWSTYAGGAKKDGGFAIAVNAAGEVCITGQTTSPDWLWGNYNSTLTMESSTYGLDAFALKLASDGSLQWGNYIGGTSEELGSAVAMDKDGNVFVTGVTQSSGWITKGGYDTSHNGGNDAFVTALSAAGDLRWATYLGGSANDWGYGIAVDGWGFTYVTGSTGSSGWALGGYDTSYGGGSSDGFAARLTSTGGRSWITYLGGGNADVGRAIAVDNDGETCVAGTTASSGWVSGGFNTTSGNAFLARLSFDGGHQWSSFLGGGLTVDALAFDAAHEIVVGGWSTGASSLIKGGYDTTYNGRSRNAFVAMIRPMGTLNVSITPPAAVSAGARWRPLGTEDWLSGVGAPVRLPVGLTDIEFMPMDGWNAPQLANVTITENTASEVFGTYTPNGSSLQVTITPPEAVAAGAQWRRVGTSTWLDSRTIDTSATPGDWQVEFRTTWGWTAPATLPVKVGYQQPFQASAAYVRQTGAVAVTITPPEAVAAGAQWRRKGTSAWLDSGVSDPAPWGSATIEFKPLAGGWGTPASRSIFIDPGQTAAVSGAYAAFGDLTVNILPPAAVAAGAQWRRTGTTTWRASGYTETNLAATAYTIEFKPLSGWNAPANAGVTVPQGRAAVLDGTYVRQTGSLSLTLSPPAAVAEGAQWRRVGQTAWLNSGDVDAALPTGSYTVEFKPTTNWLPPANAAYLVNNNLQTTAQGSYSPAGSLTVNIAPPEAVAAGAKWRRVGQTAWLNSGATETTLTPGSYSVEFCTAPGWSVPATMTGVAIVGGQTTTLAATYTTALASLNWSSYLGGSGGDDVQGIGIDGSGNIIAAGSTNSSGWVTGPGSRTNFDGFGDGFVAKLSSAGQMVWSTYVGGSYFDSCDALAVDASGGVYVTGETYSSTSWVSGGYDTSYGGYSDAFAMKLDATGQHVWSTYLGGANDDTGAAIAVDATGAAYVAGTTQSPGWTLGGWRTSTPGGPFYNGFAVKLSPSGQHVWSTYLGGGYDFAYGIAVAKSGLVYVVGDTNSPDWVSGGFNLTLRGGNDGFLVCLNGGGQHVYSSYVGGSSEEWCRAVAVDGGGNVAVAGTTGSPGWLSGGEDATYGGGGDGFVLKIDPAGKPLWGTYLGGAADDRCLGLAVDGSGKLFVTGMTTSAGWLSGGPDLFYDGSSSGNDGDAFVARLSTQGRLVWGSYLGGAKDDQGLAIATDGAGAIAVGGYTESSGWTSGGYDLIFNDLVSGNYNDGFIARLQDLLAPNSALSVTLAPPEAVTAGAAWRRVGSTTWRASGELETALQAGPATVEFKPVTGWLTPANLTLTLAELQTLTTATTYVRQPGAIQVTLTPPAAVSAGAAWRRVGTSNWLSSGDTEPGLAKGTYPVEFKPVAGWTTPANQDVAVEYAATTQAAADYVRQTGSLKVTIDPMEAVAAGAAWRRTGTTPWMASGQTETGIPTADVTIEFKPMPYWTAPANQTVAIANGQTATTNAAYGVSAALCVSIQPAAAVAAGAQWRLVGQTAWCDSDTTQTGLTPDTMVAVEFKLVSGWTQPATVSLTLPLGQGTKLSGTYVRQSGGLTVTIQPPEAVAAGAKWRRAGTLPWLDSGAVESPLYTGAETVEFKPVTGWQAPANQPVNIINGYTSPVTGTYVGLGSLRVDITPPEAVAAGAQWRRAGTSAWLNSGATEADVPAGAQTVEFKPVTGWNAPASAGVSVAQGATATTAGGAYVRQTGGLSVTILPAEAVAAGAQWRRAGSASWRASGASENGIAVGSCQIEFSTLAGWNAPVPAVATITSGTVATQSGTYVRRTGSLRVALSPAAAVTAGAQWRRKGTTAWFNSGASESGVLPGEWTVEFKDLTSAHWLAPAAAAVTVNYDQLTTLGASYSPRLVVSAATPLAVAAAPNAAATFTVSAAGAPTLKYQWKKNGVAITGATAATYKITACALTHAGTYTCEVRNSYAQTVSPQFTLAVSKSAAVIRYLLGQSTNPTGLDLNGDGKVTSADVIKGLK